MINTTVKKTKGFSSAYPNMCNLKLLPNIDGTWITIQDNVGTSMTVKLSDLSDFIKVDVLDKIKAEINGMYRVILKGTPEDDRAVKWNDCLDEVLQIIDKYKESEG